MSDSPIQAIDNKIAELREQLDKLSKARQVLTSPGTKLSVEDFGDLDDKVRDFYAKHKGKKGYSVKRVSEVLGISPSLSREVHNSIKKLINDGTIEDYTPEKSRYKRYGVVRETPGEAKPKAKAKRKHKPRSHEEVKRVTDDFLRKNLRFTSRDFAKAHGISTQAAGTMLRDLNGPGGVVVREGKAPKTNKGQMGGKAPYLYRSLLFGQERVRISTSHGVIGGSGSSGYSFR